MSNQIANRTQTAVSLRSLAESPAYQNRFKELLRDRAPQFVASLVQLVNGSKHLQECEPNTVISAAITAAALDLPIEKNLGFAHIVPYKGQAQFQMGYKGFIQLAIRTGQYRFLNACVIHEGELIAANKLTGEIVIDTARKTSDRVVGYAAYFKLVNGYEHAEYWTAEEVEAHAKRFSQAYRSGWDTPWKTDFDQMALKTVIKDLISHWGIMSITLQMAITQDQAVVTADEAPAYADNPQANPPAPGPTFAPRAITAEMQPALPEPKNALEGIPPSVAQQPARPSAAEGTPTPMAKAKRVKAEAVPETASEAGTTEPPSDIAASKLSPMPDDQTVQAAKILEQAIGEAGLSIPQVLAFYNTKARQNRPEATCLSDMPPKMMEVMAREIAKKSGPIYDEIAAIKMA